jgi:hypothetical protein
MRRAGTVLGCSWFSLVVLGFLVFCVEKIGPFWTIEDHRGPFWTIEFSHPLEMTLRKRSRSVRDLHSIQLLTKKSSVVAVQMKLVVVNKTMKRAKKQNRG